MISRIRAGCTVATDPSPHLTVTGMGPQASAMTTLSVPY